MQKFIIFLLFSFFSLANAAFAVEGDLRLVTIQSSTIQAPVDEKLAG